VVSWKGKYKRITRVICLSLAIIFTYTQVVLSSNWTFGPRPDKPRQDRDKAGYESEELNKRIRKQKGEIKHRKEIEDALKKKEQEPPQREIDRALIKELIHRNEAVDEINREILRARSKRFKIVGERAELNYVQYDDGKRVYYKDGLISRIENERIIDPLGNVTIKNTSNMTYNQKRLLESYHAETIDPEANVTITDWSGGTYTDASVSYAGGETEAEKLLIGYREVVTTPQGSTYTRIWSDAQFNQDRQLVSYREEIIDMQGNKTITNWSEGTYQDDLLVSYHKEITDIFGDVTTIDWSATRDAYMKNTSYEGEDDEIHSEYLLTSYNETIKDADGNTTLRQWSDAKYNGNEQITYYREKITDSKGNTVIKKWEAKSYDSMGRLTGYGEEIYDNRSPNIFQTKTVKGMAYDSRGQLATFYEVDVIRGRDTQGRWVDITQRIERSAPEFDEKGLLAGYREIRKKSGQDMHGNPVDFIAESVVSNITSNSYIETSYFTGTTCHSILQNWSDLDFEKKDEFLKGLYFKLGTKSIGWNDISEADRLRLLEGRKIAIENREFSLSSAILIMGVDQKSRVKRSNIVYNQDGRVLGYTDELIDESAPDLITTVKMGKMAYNTLGQMTGYDEEITSNADIVKRYSQARGMRYNASSWVIEMREERQDRAYRSTDRDGNPIYVLEKIANVEKFDIEYDALGQIVSYKERLTNNADKTITLNEVKDIVYNGLGQQFSMKKSAHIFYDTSIEIFKEITSSDGSKIRLADLTDDERSRILNGEEITIIVDGKRVTIKGSFEEKKIDLDYEISTITWATKYNKLGQVVGYIEETNQKGIIKARAEQALIDIEEFLNNALFKAKSAQERATGALEKALEAEEEGSEDAARLRGDAEEAQKKAELFRKIADLAQDAYEKIEALVEVLEGDDEADILKAELKAREAADKLCDLVEDYVYSLSAEVELSSRELDDLKELLEDAEKACEGIEEFADLLGSYQVIDEVYDGDTLISRTVANYKMVDGKGVLIDKEVIRYGLIVETKEIYELIDGEETMVGKEVTHLNYEDGFLTGTVTDIYEIDDEGKEILAERVRVNNTYNIDNNPVSYTHLRAHET